MFNAHLGFSSKYLNCNKCVYLCCVKLLLSQREQHIRTIYAAQSKRWCLLKANGQEMCQQAQKNTKRDVFVVFFKITTVFLRKTEIIQERGYFQLCLQHTPTAESIVEQIRQRAQDSSKNTLRKQIFGLWVVS